MMKISYQPKTDIVHDKATGHYFMYYWDRKFEPSGLFRAESPNETDFNFAHSYFDQAGQDIQIVLYKGKLADLTRKK